MKTYKVKFFGSMQERQQIKQQKMEVEAEDRSKVESALRKLGWKVINGLKIQ